MTEKQKRQNTADTLLTEPWLSWAMELQAIAQTGLEYAQDIYDRERYERLREMSVEMMHHQTAIPKETIRDLFCNESGYQTPKMVTRAAVFDEDKILLVHERGGEWALPGGWVDITESIASNAEKEVLEESGLIVEAQKIIALQDYKKHHRDKMPYSITTAFILCTLKSGEFHPNSETVEMGFFSRNDLPVLMDQKTTHREVEMCFEANASNCWEPLFD